MTGATVFGDSFERFLRVKESGSTLATELLSGTTTFLTMAHIIVVNPTIFHWYLDYSLDLIEFRFGHLGAALSELSPVWRGSLVCQYRKQAV